MSMLPSRLFLSEPDAFLRQFKNDHPEILRQQRQGMQLWWNRPADEIKEWREMDKAATAQAPYVYGEPSD